MVKVLFICHGNICRSPMAEFIFKKIVSDAGLENRFQIESGATSTEEIGNDIYPPAKAKLREHNVPFSSRGAWQVKAEDYEKYDYIYCMDQANYRNLQLIFGGDPQGKVKKLLGDRDVADPWYTRDFEKAYRDIREGCEALLSYLI